MDNIPASERLKNELAGHVTMNYGSTEQTQSSSLSSVPSMIQVIQSALLKCTFFQVGFWYQIWIHQLGLRLGLAMPKHISLLISS